MKKTYFSSAAVLFVAALLNGCDVSNNNGSSEGAGSGQAGDPVIVDFPIAYIERPVPLGMEEDNMPMAILPDDVQDPAAFRPGARLFIKDRASVSAAARVITDDVFPDTPPPDGSTEPATPALYDVRDLSVNPEGTKLAFAMRAPEIPNVDDEDQPTWNIWEYDIENDALTRVIESDITAEQGQDRFPVYLPDGSLVFSSTRQRTSRSILLDQSRPQYSYTTESDSDRRAFTLHRIDEDREVIDQISYGRGHDIYPTILDDGRIMFLRGDNTSRANRDRLSLYTMNPDGSNVSLSYGFHSPSGARAQEVDPDQGALVKPVQMPDGQIMVSYRPRSTRLLGGDIFTVDTENYIDLTQPTSANLGATGPAEASASFGEVVLESQSPHGYFNSAYPLEDNTGRLLVSWMPCLVQGFRFGIYVRVVNNDIVEDGEVVGVDTRYQLINIDGELVDRDGNTLADGVDPVEIMQDEIISLPCSSDAFDNDNITVSDPQFGVWIYDPATQTQDPVVLANEVGTMFTDAVVFEARTPPTFIPDAGADEFSRQLIDENVGVLHIRSIYDFDGQDISADGIVAMADPLRTPTDSREVRFVRFWEEALAPHDDEYEIDADLVQGRNGQPGRGIIGYAEVFPDGSVMTKLPANVTFSMEFIDANGRRVDGPLGIRHSNWLNVRPGEVRTCNGCHTAASTAPHGRMDAEPESANEGALAQVAFPNTALRDPFGTPYNTPDTLPEIGETMAQYYARVRQADPGFEDDPLLPSLDITYTDEWTDPASGATPGTDISLVYGVPDATTGRGGPDNLQTLPPVLVGSCLSEWSSLCRIVIDYPDHIQPIFEVDRTAMVAGASVNVTCTNCHSTVDPDGNPQAPAPNSEILVAEAGTQRFVNFLQLDFTPVVSPLDNNMTFLKAYDEFFATGDNVQILDAGGNLVIHQVPVIQDGQIVFRRINSVDAMGNLLFEALDGAGATVCAPLSDTTVTFVLDAAGLNVNCTELEVQRDSMGVPILDAAGNQIPIPETMPAVDNDRYLTARRANAPQNQRFFDVFAPGAPHDGYLTPAELKLFSEWLDIGGQYYNEIFKALDD
ncbi:PD40 domain-containing protein [Agarilytica rhodophyticola]|uniref:HzsA-related protein n=1 Tax=Agarilytica rhodophyticola TaxID=1737490 RepID=UPI000B344E5C|nr:PD40 domain-containing protein [Agarilytica rhodophyticola]